MRYYANPSTPAIREAMRAGEVGLIKTPAQGIDVPEAVTWCADNGCFGKGYPGDAQWFGWLESQTHLANTCAFAVAPDVVGDAAATLERSTPWLPRIRDLGLLAAFVAQDGLTPDATPWGQFDVLFIGGGTEWKLGPQPRILAAMAADHGIPVHMGRVNSLRRLMYADAIGCSSVDGTHLIFGPDLGLAQLRRWLAFHRNNPTLRLDA